MDGGTYAPDFAASAGLAADAAAAASAARRALNAGGT